MFLTRCLSVCLSVCPANSPADSLCPYTLCSACTLHSASSPQLCHILAAGINIHPLHDVDGFSAHLGGELGETSPNIAQSLRCARRKLLNRSVDRLQGVTRMVHESAKWLCMGQYLCTHHARHWTQTINSLQLHVKLCLLAHGTVLSTYRTLLHETIRPLN